MVRIEREETPLDTFIDSLRGRTPPSPP